ncbi:hypothetical protein EU546_05720 [Candidatus Thorarchaeota archaeon]|nr:MAG: hypothetical protein EU546_05720 [Candidatus Thorarchaeota archaeon]
MKILVGYDFKGADLSSFAAENCQKRGFIRREPTEEFTISDPFSYPLRLIHFYDASDRCLSTSLLDEYLFETVEDKNEKILLWRPRYARAETSDRSVETTQKTAPKPDEAVREFVKSLVASREESMERLESLNKDLKDSASLYRSIGSLLLPRSPTGIREQEDIAQKKRTVDGWVKATSLVLNLTPADRPTRVEVGERVDMEMILIIYNNLVDAGQRAMVLEGPVSDSLSDTKTSGRPLTRLLSLNKDCFRLVLEKSSLCAT